jgi:hypothetical protein
MNFPENNNFFTYFDIKRKMIKNRENHDTLWQKYEKSSEPKKQKFTTDFKIECLSINSCY